MRSSRRLVNSLSVLSLVNSLSVLSLVNSLSVLSIVGVTNPFRLIAQDLTPPTATIKPRIDTLHGDIRIDNYFWIRDKTNPEVIAYLNAENVYTTARQAEAE